MEIQQKLEIKKKRKQFQVNKNLKSAKCMAKEKKRPCIPWKKN